MRRKRHPVPRRAVRRLLKKFAFSSADILEQRVLLSATTALPASAVEPIGGTGNNVANPTWGAAGNDLVRLTPAQYANGYSTPSLPQDPSARLISNLVNSQADPADPSQDIATVNQQSLSDFAYSFGQFMDHDMDLTQGNGAADNISVPVGDPIGGPNDTPLSFNRSQTDPATGTGPGNPAQQVNSVSSYFDLSQIYGSDVATDNALRTFSGGQMKTSPGGLPPLDNSTYFTTAQLAAINASVGGMADDGPLPQSQMFVTGDSRGNENVELTVLQTLFLDNHNRLASRIAEGEPDLDRPAALQRSPQAQYRRVSVDHLQRVDSRRAGRQRAAGLHGLQPERQRQHRQRILDGRLPLRPQPAQRRRGAARQQRPGPSPPTCRLAEDFFDPNVLNGEGQPSTVDPLTGLTSTSIGAVLKGDADGDAQAEDVEVINEVRNELFNEVVPGVGYGQDLIALDIQRGRDNGIGSYNEVRESLGLPAVTSFSQITSNVTVQKELQAAYGNVNNIDAIEGGMAEDPVAGSDVGPLFQAIMVNQFTRLRDGDRFFYLNESFTPAEQAILNQGNTLAKVIEANTNITNLQSDVFIFQASISGTVGLNPGPVHGVGVPGITVELQDTSGDVLGHDHDQQPRPIQLQPAQWPGGKPGQCAGSQRDGCLRHRPRAPFVARADEHRPAERAHQPRRYERDGSQFQYRHQLEFSLD